MSDPVRGDFGVVHIPGRVGRLIRVGQWLNGSGFADYEHAFIYAGGGTVVEARPSGAGFGHLPAGRIAWFHCPPDRRFAVYHNALGLIGTPYSWVDYVALAAVRFKLGLVSGALRRYVSGSGRMICSQFVDECYARAGVQLFDDGRLPGDVTPGDLYKLAAEQKASAGPASRAGG